MRRCAEEQGWALGSDEVRPPTENNDPPRVPNPVPPPAALFHLHLQPPPPPPTPPTHHPPTPTHPPHPTTPHPPTCMPQLHGRPQGQQPRDQVAGGFSELPPALAHVAGAWRQPGGMRGGRVPRLVLSDQSKGLQARRGSGKGGGEEGRGRRGRQRGKRGAREARADACMHGRLAAPAARPSLPPAFTHNAPPRQLPHTCSLSCRTTTSLSIASSGRSTDACASPAAAAAARGWPRERPVTARSHSSKESAGWGAGPAGRW